MLFRSINIAKWLLWIPLLPLIGAVINGFIGSRMPRWFVRWVACGAMGGAALLAATALFAVMKLPPTSKIAYTYFDWISVGDLSIPFTLSVDRLAIILVNIITWVGFLIHVYSAGYMAHDRSYSRYFTYLNLFVFSMLILVMGDSLPLMFVGWEGVGLCSYLLIGFWFEDSQKAFAGRKAFIVNRIGDFGFLLGMFWLFMALKGKVGDTAVIELSYDFIQKHAASLDVATVVTPVCLLFFVGAMGKSAQIPLYVWLPDAMAGPTPVSALIHAATMVTAGVYMVAKLGFLYHLSPFVMAWVAAFGAGTALWSASIAVVQSDLKKILAYSTVSQLGYMFVGVGLGATTAGVFHLMTHAFFKAALFLGAGSVMHAMSNEGNVWKMGGLFRKIPITAGVMLVATLAIMGMFPFSGFFSKDEILLSAFYNHSVPGGRLYWIIGLVTAGLTSFYMWRMYFVVFTGKCRADEETQHHIHESPPSMTVPLIVLALLSLVGGWVGWPHALGGHNSFHAFLGPATQNIHLELTAAQELIPMAFALAVGIVGFAIAWFMYAGGRSTLPDRLEKALKPVHEAAYRAWRVDELYDLVIVRPVKGMAWLFHRVVDYFLIDLVLVNGVGLLVQGIGKLLRFFQNGQVQRYAVGMVIGLAAIMYYVMR